MLKLFFLKFVAKINKKKKDFFKRTILVLWWGQSPVSSLQAALCCRPPAWRAGCRRPLQLPSVPPPSPTFPSPHPVPAFSLFIYCIEDLRPQIDLWDWFGPPPPFLASTPPSPYLGLSLKRLLINPPTSSVSQREKRWVKKDRPTQKERDRTGVGGSAMRGNGKTEERWDVSIIPA